MPSLCHPLFIAGHRGMVGQAILRLLRTRSESNGRNEQPILTATRDELDLTDQAAVYDFFRDQRPASVILAAGKVGGIWANKTYPAEFLTENLLIAANVIEAARRFGTQRLLFLGSTCIYPQLAPQPLKEECLLASSLEPTNEAYAIAKIAGLKLCQYYRQQYGLMYHSCMPTNLYGPGDNYHPDNSHVLPALIHRFHQAKLQNVDSVTIWGTGTPRREFLHVDDLAAACLHLIELDNPPDWVNIGTGEAISIIELAGKIADVVGYRGTILTDPTKPDGTPVKVCDVSRIHQAGWNHQINLDDGLAATYKSYLAEAATRSLRNV